MFIVQFVFWLNTCRSLFVSLTLMIVVLQAKSYGIETFCKSIHKISARPHWKYMFKKMVYYSYP
jgi:hypothetical protein